MGKLRTLAVVMAIPFGPAGLSAQTPPGALVGEVRDGLSGAPVRAAAVLLPDLGRSTLTDDAGGFVLRDLPPGTHRLEVRHLGFRPVRREVRIGSDSTTTLAISLAAVAIETPDIAVEVPGGSRFLPGFLRRRSEREGYFFTREEIEDADPRRLSDLLRSLAKVEVRYSPREGYKVGVFSQRRMGRGESMYCSPTIVLDGRRQPEWRTLNDIEPERVLAMEVYWNPSEAPGFATRSELDFESLEKAVPLDDPRSQAGRSSSGGLRPFSATCGTILIWTRVDPG